MLVVEVVVVALVVVLVVVVALVVVEVVELDVLVEEVVDVVVVVNEKAFAVDGPVVPCISAICSSELCYNYIRRSFRFSSLCQELSIYLNTVR